MTKYIPAIFFAILSSFYVVDAVDTLTPVQIAQMTYNRYVGNDMQMRGTMELISSNGHVRRREFFSFRKDSNIVRKQLIRFTSPADINGTAFLNIETEGSRNTEQHLYLPALKRTRRIVAGQKSRSFVNSDFTFEDMQRHPVDGWFYRLDGTDNIAGRVCYILVSTPKLGTETQYSKMVSWIEKDNFIPLKVDFYDMKGHLFKSYYVEKFEIIDKIATETDVWMKDVVSGHVTRLITTEINYNSGLKDSLFTTRELEK